MRADAVWHVGDRMVGPRADSCTYLPPLQWVRQLLVRPGTRVLAGVADPESFSQMMGQSVELLPLQLEDSSSVESWADAIARRLQHVDVLIDNAGAATSAASIQLCTAKFSESELDASASPIAAALHMRRLLGGESGQTLLAHLSAQ